MSRGKAYTKGQKEFIVALKKSYDEEKISSDTISTKGSANRVSKGLKVSIRTVRNILSEYKKTGQVNSPLLSNGKPEFIISSAMETIIRRHVRELNSNGKYVSCRTICNWISKIYDIKIHSSTLWRTLKRMGFIHGQSKKRSILKERDYVVIARREYLRKKINNRVKLSHNKTSQPEVYLDESYINVNHSSEKTWYFTDDGPWVNKPSGKGPRLIILNAITENGWVPNAKLVFQAKLSTGDYHGQMNYDNFSKWFKEQLIPNIPPKSLIFMDNAKYHNVYTDDAFPTPKTLKIDLQKWLKINHPSEYNEKDELLKPELYKKCKKLSPKPKFKLDILADEFGHTIVRTPQYHPELQPIEICWGIVKNYCAKKCEYTMEGLKKHLEIAFKEVTSINIEEILKKMREEEDRYWSEDKILEEKEELLDDEFNYE
jgi:transposase